MFQVACGKLAQLVQLCRLISGTCLQHQGICQSKHGAKLAFELGGALDWPVNNDLYNLFVFGLFQQAVDLDPRQAKPRCNLILREPLFVVEGRNFGEQFVQVRIDAHGVTECAIAQ